MTNGKYVLIPFSVAAVERMRSDWPQYPQLSEQEVLDQIQNITVSLVTDPGPDWDVEWWSGSEVSVERLRSMLEWDPEFLD
jgi:hypothetical protein